MRILAFILGFVVLAGVGSAEETAAVFQYRVPVESKKKPADAFLWLPPAAVQIRGVVMAGMTLAERELAQDPQVRQACAAEQLTIVFLKCGLGAADLQKVLDDFSAASGYAELSTAPLLFFGHSAGGPQARAAAIKYHDRCFGLIQYRGAGPFDKEPASTVPPGIPTLMMVGQFDEFGKVMRDENGRENWENNRDGLAAFRAENQDHLSSMTAEPGAGHFAWSDRNAEYIALFIRKAAQARIPADDKSQSKDKPAGKVALKTIDPKTGWLTDLKLNNPRYKPAPVGEYQGDPAYASWHLDRELAEANVAHHAGGFDKKDQFLSWKDPTTLNAGARYFFNKLEWVDDGQSFVVHPEYASKYPSPPKNGPGPRWARSGQPVGQSEAPIQVKPASGAIRLVKPHTFRIAFNALAPATEPDARAVFMAFSQGDDDYRYTERVGMMSPGGGSLTEGKEQTITFATPENMKPDSAPQALKATSDSGLPVEFYVAYGPATIEQGQLKVADLPARPKYPLTIKVVAYQFGRGLEPLVKTALPVEREIVVQEPSSE